MIEYDVEIARAEQARADGNLGLARVCARRAAAAALRDYFLLQGRPVPTTNIIDLIETARQDPDFPAGLLATLARLEQRVDSDYLLPPDWDLLADAAALRHALMASSAGPSSLGQAAGTNMD